MSEYWFARRYPVGHPRSAMAPVSREGWLVAASFAASMILGVVAFAALAIGGDIIIGAVVFVAVAIFGGGAFVTAAMAKGDRQHTVADYRSGRVGNGDSV